MVFLCVKCSAGESELLEHRTTSILPCSHQLNSEPHEKGEMLSECLAQVVARQKALD